MKMLAQCGADVVALSRTQADLDSLKSEVCVHLNIRKVEVSIYLS